MSVNLLDYFLLSQLWALLMIFARVGAALMAMPGFGEIYVSPAIRLLIALLFSFLLLPLIQNQLPLMPSSAITLTLMLMSEIIIGVFFGLIARTVLMALHVAGTLIAQQSSLAVASIFDPSSGGQSAVVSNLLSITAIALFFALNLHMMVLGAIVESYNVFAAGQFPITADLNMLEARLFADAFALGVLLAAPHIVFTLLFYLLGGLMMRLMPNFQVFFVTMAAHILISLFLLLAAIPVIMQIFMNFMQDQFANFIR